MLELTKAAAASPPSASVLSCLEGPGSAGGGGAVVGPSCRTLEAARDGLEADDEEGGAEAAS